MLNPALACESQIRSFSIQFGTFRSSKGQAHALKLQLSHRPFFTSLKLDLAELATDWCFFLALVAQHHPAVGLNWKFHCKSRSDGAPYLVLFGVALM